MAKNYAYWDQIDAAVEELVDYMIQQSELPKFPATFVTLLSHCWRKITDVIILH